MTTNPWKPLVKDLESVAKALGKAEKKKKPKKGRGHKAKKPRKPKPRRWHNAPTVGEQHPSSAGEPWGGTGGGGLHAGGAAPMVELAAEHGIGGVLLDLAGEGKIGLAGALSAWQRESERVTNRAWRRPGGLQRMGGV